VDRAARQGGNPYEWHEGIHAMSEITATGWDLPDAAHRALRWAVLGVAGQDWNQPTPCSQWNVTQVLQHAAGDQLAWAAAITGGPAPSENPFTPSGHLDGAPQALAEQALQASASAWAAVSEDAPNVPTPLPQGALPARLAAGAFALHVAVHAWDLAVATGQNSPLTPDLARPLMTVAASIVEPLRAYGAYAPALERRTEEDEVAVLLRYLGRRPDWTA
jgi:uncharacterized protein (TIGR03086 family)